MTLSKKFITILLTSIIFIVGVNLVAFVSFSTYYFNDYLQKINTINREISLEYINTLIEKQTADYLDTLFIDIEREFFELLDENNWSIPISKEKNLNIVINYLFENWVSPQFIQEVIPQDTLWQLWRSVQKKDSPERDFISDLIVSIIVTNIIAILWVIGVMLIFITITINPIKEITKQIEKLRYIKEFRTLEYNKKDEIGLLITEINQLNTNLKFQENIRHRLLADISHELKTPITSIQCYLEWISDWVIKVDNNTLDNIIEEMNRLVKLVNTIMEYEQFENKSVTLNMTEEKPKVIIQEIVKQYENTISINQQNIITNWKDINLLLDKERFIQIVHNLISNFIKYAWKKSTLTITLKLYYIDFHDNWIGIKKIIIPYLTEKFYQWKTEKSWNIDERGIWVWLSIVDKLVKAHKWSLSIDSDLNNGFLVRIFTKKPH